MLGPVEKVLLTGLVGTTARHGITFTLHRAANPTPFHAFLCLGFRIKSSSIV